jgi:RNA polymerase sigma-70 factor (ECF subfamily)
LTQVESSSEAESLLRRCQQGDETALGDLMRLYQQRVFQFTLRVSGDASLAEEASVDCFYRVWTRCRQRRDDANPEAWIFRIALRAVLDLARKRNRWWKRLVAGSRTTDDDLQPGPLESLIENEQQQRLAREVESAIESLKEEDRALVHLYYFEGQTLAEIAEILETSRDALKMRLLRVRQRLSKLLESEDAQ